MKKKLVVYGLVLSSMVLSACGNKEEVKKESKVTIDTSKEVKKETKIEYLGKEFQVNYPTDKIITASLEPMEDAVALGMEPMGAVSVGGNIPEHVAQKLGKDIKNVGDKFSPNVEIMTTLQPDVILGSTKFDDSVTANLEKIAPTINVSHESKTWQDNLVLLGKLSGKEEKANTLISDYEKELKETKEGSPKIAESSAVILRVRDGELCLYGAQVYYNPMFYNELGFKKPAEIDKVKGQETISVEQFSKINPDIVFVQFAAGENKGNENYVEELKDNAIWKNMTATKNNQVYFDIVDGGYQGGTYLSKSVMLEALKKEVLK